LIKALPWVEIGNSYWVMIRNRLPRYTLHRYSRTGYNKSILSLLEWISSREGCSLLDDDQSCDGLSCFLHLFFLFRWDIWYHSGVMFWNSILHIHNYHLNALPTILYSELLLYELWPIVLRQNIWDISFLLFQNYNLGRSFLQIGKL